MKKITLIFSALFIAMVCIVACSDNQPANNSTNNNNSTPPPAPTKTEVVLPDTSMSAGLGVYQRTCIVCHQPDGTGMEGAYPPLAKSDYLLKDKFRAIHQVLTGSSITMKVNGKNYNGAMPRQVLKDAEVAQVLNYVYRSFGNNGPLVSSADVKSVRDTMPKN
jgi:mono/diheme cytochrome c family protein